MNILLHIGFIKLLMNYRIISKTMINNQIILIDSSTNILMPKDISFIEYIKY